MVKLIHATALPGYRLLLEFDDGVSGEIDLSELVEQGVFRALKAPQVFNAVHVAGNGAVQWTEQLELCGDAMYLEITGKSPDALFPKLKAQADA